ncbi:MAG: glutathione S-transferase N-terminal domain-containing protein [Pseudomonadales bacterium]|jgi:glutathione S-transferase|tara:strand:+ start:287 stop:1402 length:1116 start_codon:yes stop_codon:yes gene_type:complete
MSAVTLYGVPFSLYTGRPRSYFIKAGIPYREVPPSSEHYMSAVLPKAGSRFGIPVAELADGQVIRDGVAIVDFFESQSGFSFTPITPKQKIVSLLLDVIGAEGLLRPAMHYRWSFPENRKFLKFHFESAAPAGERRSALATKGMDRMRDWSVSFGVNTKTAPAIEALYIELLSKLDNHFSRFPYFLGNKPCIGDFGMLAPLYAHLGRDPVPLALMQENAIRLFRWVERMNRPEPDFGEFDTSDEEYLKGDAIPDSLVDVLKLIAVDFVPETKAAAECINDWLDQNPDLATGTECERGVGLASFVLGGTRMETLAQPFRFYLLERVQAEFEQLDGNSQKTVRTMLEEIDMAQLLEISIGRKIGRDNNLEVWL